MNPIIDEPALYIKEDDLLVVADLHIGIEHELRERGISIGSRTENLIRNIKKISSSLKIRNLLILGDLKHVIPKSTIMEKKEITRFAESLSSLDISLVPGNHDGNIKKMLDNSIRILPSHGIVLRATGFAHGHRWPHRDLMKADTLVLAHTHPTFSYKDRFGYKFTERCWVISKPNYHELEKRYGDIRLRKIVIVPSFNSLCGGISVNEEGFIGIIDKIVDKESMEIFLLDGTCIGKPKNLINWL